MATDPISDDLWEEFHRVVNMTSRELTDWMRAQSAGETAETFPDQSGTPTDQQVVHVLGKRRSDLTDDDITTMRRVVRKIHEQRRDDLEPTAGDAAWRHRLMSMGHDPLKRRTEAGWTV